MQSQQMSDPLAQLKDIHTPETVAVWPLDWGWWVVISLSLVMVASLIWWLYRRYRFYQGRREAISALQQLDPTQPDWPGAMNAVLKRTALTYFKPRHVASLHGMAWVSFLRDKLPEKYRRQYADGLSCLHNSLYVKSVDEQDFTSCQAACIGWVRHARLRARTVAIPMQHEAHHV